MTDFATTAKQLMEEVSDIGLHWECDDIEGERLRTALTALVAAHEADKRIAAGGAVREELASLQAIKADNAQQRIQLVMATITERLAALDTPPNGSEKPVTPPTTPLRQNAPGGRDE